MLYPKDVVVLASRQNSQKIDMATGNRPVRIIPNVGPGIVWNRRVYPLYLYKGDPAIFSDDESFEKSICDISSNISRDSVPCWNSLGETNNDWWIESQFYGHYVVFNGDEARALELSGLLEAKGFRVIRFARSFRPAANGINYDWFVRIHKDEDKDRLNGIVENFFDGSNLGGFKNDSEVDQYLARIGGFLVTEGFLNQMPNRADLLRPEFFSAIWGQIQDGQCKLDEIDCELDLLRSQRHEERKQTKYELSKQQSWLEKTLQELNDLRGERGVEFAHQEALQRKIEQLELDKVKLENDIETLFQWLEKSNEEGRQKSSRRPRTRDDDFMQAIAICNPRLAIDEDSMECLLKDFNSRDGVLKSLALIQENNHIPLRRVAGKSGNEGWMEYCEHIKDGQRSMGRIYLRESALPSITFEVVIHKKRDDKEQGRFIDALTNRSPLENQAPYLR